jgi:hypothetical protein
VRITTAAAPGFQCFPCEFVASRIAGMAGSLATSGPLAPLPCQIQPKTAYGTFREIMT